MKKYGISKLDNPIENVERFKLVALLREDKEELKRIIHGEVNEEYEKLMLLCEYYKIEENNLMFYQLSTALAREIVKGFQVKKKRGRGVKWDYGTTNQLMAEIEQLIEPENSYKGVTYATRILATKEPWKSFVSTKSGTISAEPDEALRQVYYREKRRIREISKKIQVKV